MTETLTEGPQTQRAIELVADRFINAAAISGARYLREKRAQEDQWRELWQDDMGAVTVDTAFPRVSKDLPEKLRAFIKWMRKVHLRMHFVAHAETLGRTAGATYRGPESGLQAEVTVVLPEADFQQIITNERITEQDVLHAIRKLRSLIVHEFTHAYDDFASRGRHKNNTASGAALDARIDAWVSSSDQDRQAKATELYLNDPIEVNARFSQTVSKLDKSQSWPDYRRNFTYEMKGWRDLTPLAKRRLVTRLAAYWQDGRDTSPKPDIKASVARLQKRLREMFGAQIWLTYGSNAINIDDIGTKDRTAIGNILRATSKVGDVLGLTIATSEVPYGDLAKSLGFVNQRSKRHRDFSLSYGTSIYRRPRQWKTAKG